MMHGDEDSEAQQSSIDATEREQQQLHHLQLKKPRRRHHHQQPDQQQQLQQEQPHLGRNHYNNSHQQQQDDEEQEPQHRQVMEDVCEQDARLPKSKKRARLSDAVVVESEQQPDLKLESNKESDFDAVFLQNLLPEIKAMDFKQKLIFKRRIYGVIAEVFESLPSPRLNNVPPLRTARSVTAVPNAPTMTLVSAADMAKIRSLNALLQNPHTVHSVNIIPTTGPSMSSTVRPMTTITLPPGAVTRSNSNLLRLPVVNPPIAVPTPTMISSSAPSQIPKQEPVATDD